MTAGDDADANKMVEEIQQAAANSYQYPVPGLDRKPNSRDPSGGHKMKMK